MGAQVGRDLHVTHQVAQQSLTELELFTTFGTLNNRKQEAKLWSWHLDIKIQHMLK